MSVNKLVALINKLPLPDKAWIISLLVLIFWGVDFVIEFNRVSVYYTNLLASGALPPDADSISIPILSYAFGEIMLGLIFSVYLLWALIGMQSNNQAIKFNKQKPVRSSISWILTGLWVSTALLVCIARLKEFNFILASLQLISIYCAIATNAVVQNKN